MNNIVKNIIFIVVIFAILVLSQQPHFERIGRNLYNWVASWTKILWQKCKDFWNQHILHRLSTEIEKRQEIAKEELEKQTKEVSLTIWQKIKNYISGLFRKIFFRTSQESQ